MGGVAGLRRPWPAGGKQDAGLRQEALAVAAGLVNCGGHVPAPALGLDDAHARQPDEQGIVGRPGRGRPHGEGPVAPRHGPGPRGLAARRRVRLPSPCAQPCVDEGARRLLVEVDCLGGFGCGAGEELERSRLRDRRCLDPSEFFLQREQPAFGLGRERFPDRPFLRLRLGALLRGAPGLLRLRSGTGRSVRHRHGCELLDAQPLQLVPQRGGRVERRLRRRERAGPEAAVAEGAVEPDGELPRDLEPGQRRRVVAAVQVDRLIADALEIVEQVDDVARIGHVPAETPEQVGLRLVHAHEHASPGGELLCQQLAELPKLHQAGHEVVSEVALGLRGDADQDVVVAGEEAEVGAGRLRA